MAARIIDGKQVADVLVATLHEEVAELAEQGVQPGLVTVMVGEDPASAIYVRNKLRRARKLGLNAVKHHLPAGTSEAELSKLIDRLNNDDAVDGILVQLPLPGAIDADLILGRIDPDKDVDGLHPVNLGRLLSGRAGLVPCTPAGCMHLLDVAGGELQGARAVVIGRSNLVGKPLAHLLMARHATVTVCHSRTRELEEEVGRADVVVAAVGVPELVQGAWIKPGAVVLDVGTNRVDDRGLIGDVQFESACARAGAITPVPGGVGPMTIAMLMANTIRAARLRRGMER